MELILMNYILTWMCHWLAAPVLWLTYFKQLWIIWIARVFVYVYDCLWQLLSHNSGYLNLQLLWFKMSILFINVFIKILLAEKFSFLFTLLVFPGFSHELQGFNFSGVTLIKQKIPWNADDGSDGKLAVLFHSRVEPSDPKSKQSQIEAPEAKNGSF